MGTNKGALALLVHGGTENWSSRRWKSRFDEVCAGRRVLLLPDSSLDPAEVNYAAVWKPHPGELAAFSNLRVIFNLGAGVDALMADSSLPDVPLVRVAVTDLTARMTEYVVLHVLMHHRQELYLRESQRVKRWAPKSQWAAGAISVGIMGLGTLGADAADVLRRLGFRVAGWSRSPKAIEGIDCFHGEAQLEAFLRRTDILVCLLPLTPETRGMLNRDLFSRLARDGVLGPPVLMNAGRGGLQNEADIVAALDDGTLGHATLDVFETEPLPASSPLWTHPKVTITPHNSAISDEDTVGRFVLGEVERLEKGLAFTAPVERHRRY